jgi:hypothetical protein
VSGLKERVLRDGLVRLRRGDFPSIVDLPAVGAFRLAGWPMSIRTNVRYTLALYNTTLLTSLGGWELHGYDDLVCMVDSRRLDEGR